MTSYILWVTVCLCLLTIVTRLFPFLFASKLEGNEAMQILGKRLAAYIMLLLVIYQVNPATFETHPYGWPALVSLFVVIGIHRIFRKPLLSMIVGTACFITLTLYV